MEDLRLIIPSSDFILRALSLKPTSASCIGLRANGIETTHGNTFSQQLHNFHRGRLHPPVDLRGRPSLWAQIKATLKSSFSFDKEAAEALWKEAPISPWRMAVNNLPFECMEVATSVLLGELDIPRAFQELLQRTIGNYLIGVVLGKALAAKPILASFYTIPAVRWFATASCIWTYAEAAHDLWVAARDSMLCVLGDMKGAPGQLDPIPDGHFMEHALQCPVGFTVMDHPRVLSCGHTFDASAVAHLRSQGGVCFTCQQPVAWVAPNISLLAARASCVAAEVQHVLPKGFLRDEKGRVHSICWVNRTGASFSFGGMGRVRNFKLEEA